MSLERGTSWFAVAFVFVAAVVVLALFVDVAERARPMPADSRRVPQPGEAPPRLREEDLARWMARQERPESGDEAPEDDASGPVPLRRRVQVFRADGSVASDAWILLFAPEEILRISRPRYELDNRPIGAGTDDQGIAWIEAAPTREVRILVVRDSLCTLWTNPLPWLDDTPIRLTEQPTATIEVQTPDGPGLKHLQFWGGKVRLARRPLPELGPTAWRPLGGRIVPIEERLSFPVGFVEWRVVVSFEGPQNRIERAITPWRRTPPGAVERVQVDPALLKTDRVLLHLTIDGRDLRQRRVDFYPIDGNGDPDPFRMATASRCDGYGLLHVDVLPGRYRLKARDLISQRLSPASDLFLADNVGAPIEVLWRSATLPFQLQWSDGRPANDITIGLRPNRAEARAECRPTDADGSSELLHVEGPADLVWWPQGSDPYGRQPVEPRDLTRVTLIAGENPERTFVLDAALR